MTNCEVLRTFDSLETQVFENVSLASRLAAHVKSRSNSISFSFNLWRINRGLSGLFANVHDVLEGRKIVPPPKEMLTPQQMQNVADNVEYLHRMIDYLYESSRRARLTNNSLTAGPLMQLKAHGDGLLDIVNWIETLVDPTVNSRFDRAAKEAESGEIYELSQVD